VSTNYITISHKKRSQNLNREDVNSRLNISEQESYFKVK